MDQTKANPNQVWFSEVSDICPGQSFSLQMDATLYHKKSGFQDVLVFQSKNYGRVLALDGMIQVTERDEFAYQVRVHRSNNIFTVISQSRLPSASGDLCGCVIVEDGIFGLEMLGHLPMFSHPDPQQVLIVGGGDGGILREVLKHPSVKSVVQCEIDQDVVKVSKEYLPFLADSFEHPKLQLHIGDGLAFLKQHPGRFDVIITDSSDPIGPAESLFGEAYFELLSQSLRPNGLIASQGENVWLHLDLIKSMLNSCRKYFPVVDYAYSCVPSYPSGQIGYVLCSTNKETNFRVPVRSADDDTVNSWNLRYYNRSIHGAAFILPHFAAKALSKECS